MLIDFILELKDSIDKHGIRFGILLTLYAIYRKERRNFRLDQRDADVFHNQRVIMEKLGVADQWKGQAVPFQSEEVKSLRKLYSSSQVVIHQVNQLRRKKKMGKITANLSSKKLWAFVLMVILNGLNDTLQLHLSAEAINNITQGLYCHSRSCGCCTRLCEEEREWRYTQCPYATYR
jgi:hypothetical protein